MNSRWEGYIKNNKPNAEKRFDDFKSEYGVDLKKAYTISMVEDKMLLAVALEEIIKLKTELKNLKKKVIQDE